jgi:hypothetical protein
MAECSVHKRSRSRLWSLRSPCGNVRRCAQSAAALALHCSARPSGTYGNVRTARLRPRATAITSFVESSSHSVRCNSFIMRAENFQKLGVKRLSFIGSLL